eukprot:3179825-Heterocapsa_arctica.AAC.1
MVQLELYKRRRVRPTPKRGWVRLSYCRRRRLLPSTYDISSHPAGSIPEGVLPKPNLMGMR